MRLALVLTDYGSIQCGVGHTTAEWARSEQLDVAAIDPRSPLRASVGAIKRAETVAFVYPTRSGRCNMRTLLLLSLTRILGMHPSLHLHEFRRLHWLHRAYTACLIVLASGPVIVSTETERRYARRLARRKTVFVCPAPAGAIALDSPYSIGKPCEANPVIGVFGIPRRDKALDLLWTAISSLLADSRAVVELAGSGWRMEDVPDEFRCRVRVLGAVPQGDLAAILSRWSLALAPLSDGASDGRNSVRVPCAYGVPVATVWPSRPSDLSFHHRGLFPMSELSGLAALEWTQADREDLSGYARQFELECRRRLSAILKAPR